jgi:hypothetical protein
MTPQNWYENSFTAICEPIVNNRGLQRGIREDILREYEEA